MCGSDRKWPRNNTRRPHRRDWRAIKKTSGSLLTIFPLSGLLSNPFVQETESLVNFATGVELTSNVAEGLVRVMKKVENRRKSLNTNTVNLWDPVPSLKVNTFSTMSERMLRLQMTSLLLYNADKDLFGRLHINNRQINLKEGFCYELSLIPCALAHQDGSLWKTLT